MSVKKSSFVRQAAILAAASVIVRLIGFVYRLPLLALVGDVGNAFYSTAYAIYGFAIVLSSGALPAAVSKLVSERIAVGRYHDAHELFKNALVAAAVVGAVMAFIMGFGANWFTTLRFYNFPEAAYSIRVLAPTFLLWRCLRFFGGIFRA